MAGSDRPVNATHIFIHPEEGMRIINDVHSIAAFEYGAAHASQNIKNMLEKLAPGKTEIELASDLNPRGLVLSCHSILAAGENRFRGLISPTDRKVEKGDAFSGCMGMEGGLSSRCGYAAESEEDIREECRDYLEKVAKPYYAAASAWYEGISIDSDYIDICILDFSDQFTGYRRIKLNQVNHTAEDVELGNLVRGSNNAAGEVGHIILESSGRRCDCGCTGGLSGKTALRGISQTINYL